jgi:copper chaperone NosL
MKVLSIVRFMRRVTLFMPPLWKRGARRDFNGVQFLKNSPVPTLAKGGKSSACELLQVFFIFLFIVMMATSITYAGQKKPVKPAQKDKCPVCGMFVYKYPDFVAEIIFRDSSYAVFDGAKDMFKYYFNLSKYNPQKTLRDIDSLYVTDYYDLVLTDARQAFYVIGSDVYGPMGKELIPFVHRPDAQEFMRDHRGNAILQFREITPKTIEGLD